MVITVLFYIFVAVTGVQLCYYLSFLSFAFHKTHHKEEETSHPVSVIICAKNEAENLEKLIPLLLKQSYPKFELVIINDASTDSTLDTIEKFQRKDSRVKLVNVENNEAFWGNKKYALTLGIKAARYEHLLFTDADCIPASKNWLQMISAQFSETKSIVLGYGQYQAKKYSLVNLLVRYETLLTAIQYFSYAKLGAPYMAVGRNLAYTKSEFFKVKGFINHMNIRSGDDDLFIKDAATNTNTTISVHPDSFTISEAPKSVNEWFRQKRRHISTASHYKSTHKFLLGLFYISKILIWILAPVLYLITQDYLVLFLLLGYLTINYLSVGFSAKKLKEIPVLYFLPFLEIFLVLFQFTIFITNTFSKPTHWK
ncbi:MAG: glycosyltransferase [Flavobacteriaceae bacterium]|nr:glycosyltransferase [Flavobacteriaceae bacterium]